MLKKDLFMQCSHFAESKTYYSFFEEIDPKLFCAESSVKSRFSILKIFIKLLLLAPFGLLYKAFKSALRVLGVFCAASILLLTLGTYGSARVFFLKRLFSLAKDLGDWVLFPFAFCLISLRFLLALLVSPSIFCRF